MGEVQPHLEFESVHAKPYNYIGGLDFSRLVNSVTTRKYMHEYGITETILSMALEKAGEAKAVKITRINLVLGEMSGIDDECVQFYFDFLSKNTAASGAGIFFTKKPTTLRCRSCETVFPPKDFDWSCPQCHQPTVEIVSGRECYMESIEVE